MINADSTLPDWIYNKTKEFYADPIIVEKVIRALILLESLKVNNLDFIFKGGTALMLMIQKPRRFSIDIDIIVKDKSQEIIAILDKVVDSTDFTGWAEHERNTKSAIEKAHYKFFYTPVTEQDGDVNNILLDIVLKIIHTYQHRRQRFHISYYWKKENP